MFVGVSSESTLFAQACQTEYIQLSITSGKSYAQTRAREILKNESVQPMTSSPI